ncbi:hypothetical protein ACQP0C_12990 [Nocardia sp. CA-129566]|uniref:hypothetical protein n=1 Tax=Nocardia sp. CA-129566 TaxID=3239976 RepID=UPI003D990D4C
MLDQLSSFTLWAHLERGKATVFGVYEPFGFGSLVRRKRPTQIALLRAIGDADGHIVFEVTVGKNPRIPVGVVSRGFAQGRDGICIGEIRDDRAGMRKNRIFDQYGLGGLPGKRAGAAGLHNRRLLRGVAQEGSQETLWWPFQLVGDRLQYRSAESAGFEIRHRGSFHYCHVDIHDKRVNRLLVLSCAVDYLSRDVLPSKALRYRLAK